MFRPHVREVRFPNPHTRATREDRLQHGLIIMTVETSPFHNLPVELLNLIFQNLRRLPDCLCSLALSCRKFREITSPILYSSIFLTDRRNCEQLSRTIIKRPWLSSFVRELQVHYHDDSHSPASLKDQNHEPLLEVVFELQYLETLVLRSLPLPPILDEASHRLLGMFSRRKTGIKSGTQYAGQRLRSCMS